MAGGHQHNQEYYLFGPILLNFSVVFRDVNKNFPYIALISAFAAQMALLGLFFFLSLSLPERVTLWSRIIPAHVRERER